MPLEYSCVIHTVTESKGADPTEAADHLIKSKIMWNKQFVVIKNNKLKKTECVYRTTLTFCSVLVTTGYLLQLADMLSLSILHTLKPHEDLWVYANYQTQLKHWHYMCVNVHAHAFSMVLYLRACKYSLWPYQCGADSMPIAAYCLWAVFPLSDVLHGCQVGLWERTAMYEVFIPSVPGWDCTAQHSMSTMQRV